MNDLTRFLSTPTLLLKGIAKEKNERSLITFLRNGWKWIDPAPFIDSWHLDAIAEHLQAVTDGEIRKLIINCPPRHSKSSLVSVAFPAWTWIQEPDEDYPLAGPSVQFLSSSYAQNLSTRDALKSRRLIQSPWYQEQWRDRFALTSDQNAKTRYENDKGGYRIATSVGGSTTGEGGSIIMIDDPLNAKDAISEAMITDMVDWWDQTMSTRLNDPKTGAYIVIMQRLSELDLTGHILDHDVAGEWEHLVLPARFESDRRCVTSIGWEDPRTEEGEILSPDRFDDKALISLEASLGTFGAAGQLQQRPSPKGGGIIRRDHWQLWGDEDNPENEKFRSFPRMEYILVSADTAYTEKEENDPSAITVWGVFQDATSVTVPSPLGEDSDPTKRPVHRLMLNEYAVPRVMLMHCQTVRMGIDDLVATLAKTCRKFKANRLLIEAKASGISAAQMIERLHADENWGVELIEPKGDKVARVYSVEPIFAAGMVFAPWKAYDPVVKNWRIRQWADDVITEFEKFPKGTHDDRCLVGETLIATKRGFVQIRDVVKGDEVVTPDGWRLVVRSWCSGVEPVISRMGITGTEDHPVFTLESGYQQMVEVDSSSQAIRIDLCGFLRTACLRWLSSRGSHTASWEDVGAIISLNPTLTQEGKVLRACMSRFGSIIAGRKFRLATISIIRMATLIIASLRIWSAYRVACTKPFLKTLTTKNKIGILTAFGRLLRLGMPPTRGESGIDSMFAKAFGSLDMFAQQSKLREPKYANGAVKNLSSSRSWLNFVAPSVAAKKAASVVGNTDSSIRIMPVYNLEIEGSHCYYANGVLVHNCDSSTMALSWLRNAGMIRLGAELSDDSGMDTYNKGGRSTPLYPS